MELRNCSVKHSIQTIRGGLVIKVSNIDSHGSPVAWSKSLKDVYDSEDAKRLQKSLSGSVFDNKLVKHNRPCSLVAPRILWEVKPDPDDFALRADGDSDSDLDDSTTLSNLRNRVLTKKRKYVATDENSKIDYAGIKVEDEYDLYEPLINLKPKHAKASRAKRICLNPSVVSSPTSIVAINSEENLVFESSLGAGGELAPVIRVKSEVPDAEQLGSEIKTPSASSAGGEVLIPGQKIHEYGKETLLGVNKFAVCLTNEISYDYMEDIQPIPMIFPVDEASNKLLTPGSAFEESLGSSLVKQKEVSDSRSSITSFFSDDPKADVSCHTTNSLVVEDMLEESSSGSHVPDMAIHGCLRPRQETNCIIFENKAEANIAYEPKDSSSDPGKNSVTNMDSITTSSTNESPIYIKDDTISDEEQLSTSSINTIMRNELNSEGDTEDELLKASHKQNSMLSVTCAEDEYSLEEISSDNADKISTPEQHQLPERLFSTRKALSPSSQERLCLAMNSAEIWEDSDLNKCKGKLIENQIRKKPSSLRSEVQYDKKTVNHRLPGQVSQQKVIISPRRIIKRSQIAKANLEGPRFTRTLPKLSTGCTSVEGCSESAVAFSQRQMHDMESIALKLMNELKTMKDIVEQKLLFEAYRNVSLKSDADEVKSSISNATKAEEMARKWMSMMARDCNRFCKIMKMMPDSSTSSSKDTSPNGKRKIMFADEAGGKLCHVRYFDDGTADPASNAADECGHQM